MLNSFPTGLDYTLFFISFLCVVAFIIVFRKMRIKRDYKSQDNPASQLRAREQRKKVVKNYKNLI